MPLDERNEEQHPNRTAPVDNSSGDDNGATKNPAPVEPTSVARRRLLSRRNLIISGVALVAIVALLLIVAALLYRTGQVDRIIANQIVSTLDEYNIRAEIGSFETKFSPRTVEMRDIKLYDKTTGAPLGNVKQVLATVRVEDLYALNLRRNVNLEKLEIDGLEAWVAFDEQGRSNFANINLPSPDPNRRILFSYSTAQISIKNSTLHYADERYEISGTARNVRASVQPDDLSQPAESRMNRIELALDDSTLTYNNRPVNPINIQAKARVNQTRAEISELVLTSPVLEAKLSGVMDDWRELRYRMNVESSIDLTQANDVLQTGATLRGAGRFNGTVTGEKEKYRVEGRVESDALAADNVRLQGLTVVGTGAGEGARYEAQGRAVAELLTAGDFRLNGVQLAGNVMGTGKDFRWLGELRAAAARQGQNSITNLIASDTLAELQDNRLIAQAASVRAGSVNTPDARLSDVAATGVRATNEGDTTNFSAASVQAGNVTAQGARVRGLVARGVTGTQRGAATSVVANSVTVNGLDAAGARTGSINIAGVRLAITNGRIEATSQNINVGTIAFQAAGEKGQANNVRLARPRFVLEPSGRYRASADLSLGGGALGTVALGQATSQVVATNDRIELNNLNANVFNGRAAGNAIIATNARGTSRVNANFDGLQIENLLALTGQAVPFVSGTTNGSVDLTFPGTNVKAARGSLTARFNGDTGRAGADQSARTPLSGEVALRADRGLFSIEQAQLRTAASSLVARGAFSFERNSNLQLEIASSDASELQRIVVSTGLLPSIEESLRTYNVQLAGNLKFDGTLRGSLKQPTVDGHASVGALVVQERELGALAADLNYTPAQLVVTNGTLTETDGGGAQFAATIPFGGQNNINVQATLDRVNAGNLLAIAPVSDAVRKQLGSLRSDLSGRVDVRGLPNQAEGAADLNFSAGQIANVRFDGATARATFQGSQVKLENLNARLAGGTLDATGAFDTKTQDFNLSARGDQLALELFESFTAASGGGSTTQPVGTSLNLGGTVDFTAQASGNYKDRSNIAITLDGASRNASVNGNSTGAVTLVGRTESGIFNGRLTFAELFGQPQTVVASVDLKEKYLPATIEADLANADLTTLFALLVPQSNVKVRIAGQASGRLRVVGNLIDDDTGEFSIAALRGTATFSNLAFQIEDVQLAATTPLTVDFAGNEIDFKETRFTGTGTNILLGGTLALGAGGRQALTVNGDVNLRALNGASPNLYLGGMARVAVRITGSYEEPRLTGTATLKDASLAPFVANQRLYVSNINASVIFNQNQAQIQNLTGRLGGGRVTATGGALLVGFRPADFRVRVRADEVTVPFPTDFRTTADADIVAQGSFAGANPTQLISGRVQLRRAEYTEDLDLADLINRRGGGTITEGGGGGAGAFGTNLQLDLSVEGRDALVVRNNLADAVGSVSLQVRGAADDPVISGRVQVTRGTLNFRNDRYEITRGFIDLPPRREIDPILNIQAESEIRGYRVIVALTGALSSPQASVRSDPALPQSDVIALITTGDLNRGDEGGATLAQSGVGTAASLLTDTLINAPAQRATDRLFGLNRFEIDPVVGGRGGASPTARLTVGRRINRNLIVTYSTNVTSDQNQVIAVEYRVSDRLSFVAQYEQGSTNTLGTSNNNFNFEIRFRKRF